MSLCKCDCTKCTNNNICNGCEKSNGNPCGLKCFVYDLIKESGFNAYLNLKKKLVEEVNSLQINGLNINDLNLLPGYFINLEYKNGDDKVKYLNDNEIYLGNQVEFSEERCYGIACNENIILICEYGCNGSNPKLVLFKERKDNYDKK